MPRQRQPKNGAGWMLPAEKTAPHLKSRRGKWGQQGKFHKSNAVFVANATEKT